MTTLSKIAGSFESFHFRLRQISLANLHCNTKLAAFHTNIMKRLYQTSAPLRRRVRDYIVNGMTKDGLFRVALIDNTQMVNTAQQRFQYNIKNKQLTAEALSLYGKTMSCSALISSFLKGEERIRVEAAGTGLVNQICTESIQLGETRGYMLFDDQASYSKRSPLLSAEQAPGVFSVTKILYNNAKAAISSVGMTNGTISDELIDYFRESEQVPTASHLDTIMILDDESKLQCLFSFGMIVQALPVSDADVADEQRELLQDLQKHMIKFSERFQDRQSTREQAHEKLFTPGIVQNDLPLFGYQALAPLNPETVRYKPIDFMCRCSLDGVLQSIAGLGHEEVLDMQRESNEKKSPIDVTCDYCHAQYPIGEKEFTQLYQMISDVRQ
jgi:molecular chaperone Hsp33